MREADAAQSQGSTPLISAVAVTKSFGNVHALKGVNLEIRPGEVHALLGENGAGKSTLIKILSGVLGYDGGSIQLAGRQVRFASPAESRRQGIAVVYQDLSLVDSLSVGANLLLGREPTTLFGFVRARKITREVTDYLTQYGVPLDPRKPVGALPFAYRQMTEICKALIGEVRVLILDEPTSALTSEEEEILFDAVRRVTARGVGVIYVTHRLNEVFRISQRVTVFRDGSNVGTYATADTTMKQLVQAIVGPGHPGLMVNQDAAHDRASPAAPLTVAPPVLDLRGVRNDRLRGVDLVVRAGEIHGLAGLIGSGRTEILESIFGLRPVRAGTMTLDDGPAAFKAPADAIARGIALVPEDRHMQGLVLDHTIERNLAMPRLPHLSRFGWIRRAASLREARDTIAKLGVKAPGPGSLARNLSGGNQQKVVFGKWRDPRPKLLLLDEPTVGVDVGAREEIYGVARDVARTGSAVLVVSSDLAELLLLCDRISIVVDGRVMSTLDRSAFASEQDLHHLIQTSQSHEKQAA